MSESSGLGEKGFIFDFLTRNDETETPVFLRVSYLVPP